MASKARGTPECEQYWTADYAVFFIECDLELMLDGIVGNYVKFKSDLFWNDMRSHLQNVFGKNVMVVVTHYPCEGSKWEIVRKENPKKKGGNK